MQRNVICIKWGSKYGPDFVAKLHSMVTRNLAPGFRFVCFTDDRAGIPDHIECRDIPATGIADFDGGEPWTRGHGWLKVAAFAPDLGLEGPTLFLDLDIVIVDRLEPFFEAQGDFLVIDEWDKRDATGNTSAFRFQAGAHGGLLTHLAESLGQLDGKFRNEQEFVSDYFARAGLLRYWPKAWCVSFKRHCMAWGPLSWVRPARIPEGARIVVFHGRPNPPDVLRGVSGKWYRKVLPVDWVEEMWR